jgi:transcription initiation factor TFIID subunit TAF12
MSTTSSEIPTEETKTVEPKEQPATKEQPAPKEQPVAEESDSAEEQSADKEPVATNGGKRKSKRKPNKFLKAWTSFVAKVQKEEGIAKYSDAIKRAKVRKDKGEKWMGGQGEMGRQGVQGGRKTQRKSKKQQRNRQQRNRQSNRR